jgi:hypothetical protein
MKIDSSSNFYAPESDLIAGKRAELEENFLNQKNAQVKIKPPAAEIKSDYVLELLKNLRNGS